VLTGKAAGATAAVPREGTRGSAAGCAPSCASRVDGEAVLQPFNGKSGLGADPIGPFGFGRVS
jgi:hypothetical protein